MKEKINAKIGETFKVGEFELIRFKDTQGGVAVVFNRSIILLAARLLFFP